MSRLSERTLQGLAYLVIFAAVAAFVGYFLIYSYYAYRLFQFPFDYDQGEGFELLDTILFSQGRWPYRDSNVYPFYSSNYPPVYHLVVVPLVWIFGPQYWTGRLVAYLGTLVTAGAIGYAVYRRQPRRYWWLVLLAALSFLASNYVYHVGPLFRQHLFMVMFETLAVVLVAAVVSREEREKRRWTGGLLLVMILLLLAGYTKQLAYATVATVFIFLFLRQPKRAILWSIPFAAVTGLIFLAINLATDGQWYINTVSANINEFIPGQTLGLFRQWFALHTVLILVAGSYTVYQLYFERLSVYAIWFFVAVANSITAGKWGAGESYFVTAIAASCILTGIAFSRILNRLRDQKWPWQDQLGFRAHTAALAIVPALFLIQALLVFHLPTHTPGLKRVARLLGQPETTMVAPQTSCSEPRPPEPIPYVDEAFILIGRPPTDADTAAGMRSPMLSCQGSIAAAIEAGDTPAFSEEAGFNIFVGREVVTNPTQLLNLYKAGALDLTEMINMIDQQEFDTIIFRAQFYPPPILDMIGQRYQTESLVEMNGFVYCILRPR